MANASKDVPLPFQVVSKGAGMTTAELKLARADIKVSRSAKDARRFLIDGFEASGRTIEDMSAPEKNACQAFWIDLNKLSFEAMGAKMSDKGHPEGKKYNIAALLEGNPADQPTWVMEKRYGTKGDRTLRQHWQGQVGSYLKEVRESWEKRIAAATALTATPDERTRRFNVVKLEQIKKIKTSFQKATDATFCITTAVKMLDDLSLFIAASDDTVTLDFEA